MQGERIHQRLSGQHILLTGSTGFLAKVFVEKLLRSFENVASVHLLVRPKSDGTSPSERVEKELLRSSVFDRLRASLGERFADLCAQKLHVVGGDLTRERLGLSRSDYDDLASKITLVVNSAATVTFDEQLDLAVQLNTLGPTRLLKFARDAGNIPLMHVSTCYVCGVRKGVVIEDFSAPEPARESLPRGADGEFDLDRIVADLQAEASEIRHRFAADQDRCRRELIDAGMKWARRHGWNDTYTFTKWVGERILLRDGADLPIVVFRPAIIEGSFDEPTQGWIDGLRMADPILIAYGRGKIKEFPADPRIPLDLIPADFVANAMLMTLPLGSQKKPGVRVFQCASSDRNPLFLRNMRRYIEVAYRRRPMNDESGRPIVPAPMTLVEQNQFVARWSRRRDRLTALQSVVRQLPGGSRRARRMANSIRQIEQVIYFAKIYGPYTHLDCRFADDNLRVAAEQLHEEDRALLPFDVERIDWQDYIVNRHIPGLRQYVLGRASEPSARIRAVPDDITATDGAALEVLEGDTLFEVFERAAQRYRSKPALQIKRAGRWLRYSYADAFEATGAIAQRFKERGLELGDRVAICAQGSPEWALTYLAVMRAGLTAIPLDPQLSGEQAWASARFAEAKLMVASPSTQAALEGARGESDVDIVVMREPLIPRPGAARDTGPRPAPLTHSSVASILFTSGTTVSAKAVQLSHKNFIENARALVRTHPVSITDELLSVLPMYHAFEFTAGFLVPLVSGATITYVDQLKGAEITAAMQATGTTKMLVVPRLLRMFHDSIQSAVRSGGLLKRAYFRVARMLSAVSGGALARLAFYPVHKNFGGRLEMFVSGGSRLEPEVFDAFQVMGLPVYEGYGLTETAPVLTVNPPGRSKRCSVGPPLPNVELELRGQNLEGVGEVWVKAPTVMKGYLKNDEATREVIEGGWFRTGDLGRMDSEGFLYLTGRSKDLIVTAAGKNVYPDEVEALYSELPHAKELCVFGLEDDDGQGEQVHAVVVLDAENAPELDRSSLERDVRDAAADLGERVPMHQRIARFHFWDRELPKTSTLKAKRGVIRDMVAAERQAVGDRPISRSTAATGNAGRAATSGAHAGSRSAREPARVANEPALHVLQELLSSASRKPASEIGPGSHLQLDLGIDSIGRIDIVGSVESHFAMRIDDEQAARLARVSDILKLIGDREPVRQPKPSGDAFRRALGTGATDAPVNGTSSPALLPMRWFVRGSVQVLMNTWVRVHAVGRENIPKSGPFILAPNHSSHLDTPAVITAVGGVRRVWTAGAEDYFFDTPTKRLVFGKLLDTIAFDRHSDGVAGLRRCGAALSGGYGLLLFPEGTRSPSGEIQPFKVGVAVLAIERSAPIVPVHIHRTYDLLPKGKRVAKPGSVTVRFGAPVHPPETNDTTKLYEEFRALTERVEQAVRGMAEEAHR